MFSSSSYVLLLHIYTTETEGYRVDPEWRLHQLSKRRATEGQGFFCDEILLGLASTAFEQGPMFCKPLQFQLLVLVFERRWGQQTRSKKSRVYNLSYTRLKSTLADWWNRQRPQQLYTTVVIATTLNCSRIDRSLTGELKPAQRGVKEVLRRENQGLKVYPVDGSYVFSMTGTYF